MNFLRNHLPLDKIQKIKDVVLLGHFKVYVGSSMKEELRGKYGENLVYGTGERIREICKQYTLKIMNGFFEYNDIHNYT